MATRTELDIKRQKRRLEQLRKQQRTISIFVTILSSIIIILSFVSVKKNFDKPGATPPAEAPISDNTNTKTEPLPETEPDILKTLPKGDGVKTAYLTFDDGPTTSVTPHILDILRRYDIKATFFLAGSLAEKNPGIALRAHSEGHLLANHSYSHDYSDLYASGTAFMSEIDKAHAIICNITGDKNYPKIFRFPGGSYDAGTYGKAKQEYKVLLKDAGFRYCDWNSLSGDAESKSPTVDGLIKRVKSSSKGKEDLVILMHDSATKKVNIKALPQIIDYLISEGYTFDTLDNVPNEIPTAETSEKTEDTKNADD